MVQAHKGVSLRHKEGNDVICREMDIPGNPHLKQSEPDSGGRYNGFSLPQNLHLNIPDLGLRGLCEERREMKGREEGTREGKKGQCLALERQLSG